MDEPERFALAQLDRLQPYFQRVEGKLTFLLALNLSMAGLLAVNLHLELLKTWVAWPATATVACLGVSLANIYAGFFPDLRNPTPSSAIYFADIANLRPDAYAARVRAMTADELTGDAVCQVWVNSRILRAKFNRSKVAFIATGAAALPWVLCLAGVATLTGAIATE
jgi:hypothetical protein